MSITMATKGVIRKPAGTTLIRAEGVIEVGTIDVDVIGVTLQTDDINVNIAIDEEDEVTVEVT